VSRAIATLRSLGACVLVLALGGCATFSKDGGFEAADALARERGFAGAKWQRSTESEAASQRDVAEAIAETLTAERAVEIALRNNQGLQAAFEALSIAEADLVQATRLRNPTFSFSRTSGGGHVEIERTVLVNVLAIATMPLAKEFQDRNLERAQLDAAADIVAAGAEARRAYFSAVASNELVRYQREVKDAADASSELARRMVQAGNFSKLAHMREQAFYADATAQLARAMHQAAVDRERLARALGLASSTGIRLPDRLPELPATLAAAPDVERVALERRLDVLSAKRAAEALARSLDLTRATGVVNVLEAGYTNRSETGEPRANGYEIELTLPLFDFGDARTARAQASYRQAVKRVSDAAIQARSQVRESYSAYRTTYDLAKHYRDEVVPLRKRISEENLLRYNGMLIGVFELLADAREQVGSVTAAIEALRDFWLAETDLQVSLAGRGAAGVSARATRAPTTAPSADH